LEQLNFSKASQDSQYDHQSEIFFERNLQRLQESVNRRKKWRMNDFIRKKILRQTIENKIIFYRETQLQKYDVKFKDSYLENPIKSSVSFKRDLPLRSISLNDFDFQNSASVRSMPDFNESTQKFSYIKPIKPIDKTTKNHDSSSPTNAVISNSSPDFQEIDTLVVSGASFKESRQKKNKEKIKALKKYFNTKPKTENDLLPMIRETTELQISTQILSPRNLLNDNKNKQSMKPLPKISSNNNNNNSNSKVSLNDSLYKGYYTSSFQLISTSASSLPVINLNKISIVNPTRTHDGMFDNKATNYGKFISNLKNKNFDKSSDIDYENDRFEDNKNEISSVNSANMPHKVNKLNINFTMGSLLRNNS
jgi:hypothetical protein